MHQWIANRFFNLGVIVLLQCQLSFGQVAYEYKDTVDVEVQPANAKLALFYACQPFKLPARFEMLGTPAVIQVLSGEQREQLRELKADFRRELSGVSKRADQNLVRASHRAVLDRWVSSELSPEQKQFIDEVTLAKSLKVAGLFALEDPRSLAILGISDRRKEEILRELSELKKEFVKTAVEDLLERFSALLDDILPPRELSRFLNFIQSKED
jgi:hypothetical protein